MKKLLMILLMAGFITPSLALAKNDNSHEDNRENGRSHMKAILERSSNETQDAQISNINQKEEKSSGFGWGNMFNHFSTTTPQIASSSLLMKHFDDDMDFNSSSTVKEQKKEKKNSKIEAFDNDRDDHHYFASSTPPIDSLKTNYYLCKTANGWDVIPAVANGSKPAGFCIRLPHGIAKLINHDVATSTPDIIAPNLSSLTSSLVSTSTATISWTTNEDANGNVYVSTVSPVTATGTPVGATLAYTTSHSFGLTGLTPHTTYYYLVTSTDASGNKTTSVENSFTTTSVVVTDTTAPVISAIFASVTSSTSTTVTWNTDESANSIVYFSTSTPVNTATAESVNSGVLATPHSIVLNGLNASTTYYYIVKSADAANNSTTSVEHNFVTAVTPDVTATVISSVALSGIASTTATVSWNTNELSTGKLYFGTSTPLTTFVNDPVSSLTHSLSIVGLTASTTYSYFIQATDGSSNSATSTTGSFTTSI